MKFESSIRNQVFVYLFLPIWTLLFLGGIFLDLKYDNDSLHKWTFDAAIGVGYILIWGILLIIKLRRGFFYEDHFIIKHLFRKDQFIYSEVESVYEIVAITMPIIFIKIRNKATNKLNSILMFPKETITISNIDRLFRDGNMTTFIREKAIMSNKGYSSRNESSRWKIVGLFLVIGLVITGISKIIFHFLS
jgi:hypothetical protein